MDALTPIAGVSLELYAELSALVVDQPDAQQALQLIQQKGVSREDWLAAKAGWGSRVEDPALNGVVSVRFVPAYQAALTQHHGPGPSISFEDFVLLSAQIMHAGLSATLARLDLELFRYTQIAFHWNAAMSREPQKFVAYVCMVEAEILRMHRGGERRGIASLAAALATQATSFVPGSTPPPAPAQEPASAYAPAPAPTYATAPVYAAAPAPAPAPVYAPASASAPVYAPAAAPAAVPAPAPVPAPVPVPAPAPAPAVQQPKTIEQEAGEAAKAVGGALMSGFNKLGNALDSFGKSITKPGVGSSVLVTWSDGNKYPGTVAQVAPGQYFVTMGNGQQHWVAEQFVSMP